MSTYIRDLVHSRLAVKSTFTKNSLPSYIIFGGIGLPFCDEVVKNPMQLVSPLVFVHAIFSYAEYPI